MAAKRTTMKKAKATAKPRGSRVRSKPAPVTKLRNPDETRRRLLDAATKEFCDHGFHGARIDRIAARAGANKRLLYAYVGDKEQAYLQVLEQAYQEIRSGERMLNMERMSPEEGMRTLARFTFQHFQRHPNFIRLLIGENLNEARFLKRSAVIQDMHSPLVDQIRALLKRGETEGVFRKSVDPVQLYILIAALGFFYLSNRYTLSTIFGMDLMSSERLLAREEHIVALVMGYLAVDQASDMTHSKMKRVAGS